ncbi:hypothetical protein C2S52_021725 [Perilla frutescens var. hirtella]|nr:hypothetical protein C2S52_021725 [Perilla frutescens var. hirtella]
MPKTRNTSKMEKVIDEIQSAMDTMSTRVSVVEVSLTSVDKTIAPILARLEERSSSEKTPMTSPSGSQTRNKSLQDSRGGSNGNTEGSGDGSGDPHVTSNMPRMDLPLFDGHDPLPWLAQAKQYFMVHRTPLCERAQLTPIAMTGRSMFWAQWVLRRSSTIPWGQFAQVLIEQFGDSSAINAYEAMHLTRQTGSLEDYLSLFEERMAQLPSLPPEHYLGTFLGRLQPAIWERIPDSEITNAFAAIRASRRIARSAKPSLMQPRATLVLPSRIADSSHTWSRWGNSQLPQTGSSWSKGYCRSRHLIPEQFDNYRPYTPLHKCASNYLSVIISAEEEDKGEANDKGPENLDSEQVEEFGTELQQLQLSRLSSKGFNGG